MKKNRMLDKHGELFIQKIIVLIIVAISFIAGFYVATQTNLLSGAVQAYPQSTDLSTDVLSSVIDEIELEVDFDGAISELNAEVSGVDGSSAQDVINWYNYQNSADGWTIYTTRHNTGHGWNAYLSAWTKGTSGRVVLAVDGALVGMYTEYDTVIVTSHAPLWVYERYFT